MAHFWHWLINFMGINFGQNSFSTHMYNFWSGFGGDITEFALVGTIIAIYRNHIKNTTVLNGFLKKEMERSREVLLHKDSRTSQEDKSDVRNDSHK